jgi:hypothetical protein
VLLKRYVFSVAAGLAVALGAAGGVLAGNSARSHPPAPHRRLHPAPPRLSRAATGHHALDLRADGEAVGSLRAGCSAARRHERGFVILDFGKPAFKRHGYRTITEMCDCGLRPTAAHRVLADALDEQGVGHVSLPVGGTNIVG